LGQKQFHPGPWNNNLSKYKIQGTEHRSVLIGCFQNDLERIELLSIYGVYLPR
jgi:hypothetical protein